MSGDALRGMDLNLLVILDLLLQERSVSRAAARLHLTPSAVSHALRRLRSHFDDELLVRDGRRMKPTVRAQELGDSLPRALQHLSSALVAPEPFEAGSSRRTFRLAGPDFVAPAVLAEIGRAAPGVRVEWVPGSPTAVRELARGRYDALIASGALKDEGLRETVVGEYAWRVYGRSGHPAFERWSLEAWLEVPHLQIGTSLMRGLGPIERRVSSLGLERRVGAVVPHFSMAASVLTDTDLLLTIPSVGMESARERYSLESREVPFEFPRMTLTLFRSATNGDEPGVRWFLDCIERACRGLLLA